MGRYRISVDGMADAGRDACCCSSFRRRVRPSSQYEVVKKSVETTTNWQHHTKNAFNTASIEGSYSNSERALISKRYEVRFKPNGTSQFGTGFPKPVDAAV